MNKLDSTFNITSAADKFRLFVGSNNSDKTYWHLMPDWTWIAGAIQVLIEHHPLWKFNGEERDRLWSINEGVFIKWISAWNDIKLILEPDHPASFMEPRLIAWHLTQVGAAAASSSPGINQGLWLVQPNRCHNLHERKEGRNYSYMVKIMRPEQLFTAIPPPVMAHIKER